MRHLVVIGFAVVAACDRSEPKPGGSLAAYDSAGLAPQATAVATTSADSLRARHRAFHEHEESPIPGYRELEDSVETDSLNPRAPAWLIQLGHLTARHRAHFEGDGSPKCAEWAEAHAQAYRGLVARCDRFYNGFHYREVVRRFPNAQLADSAAFLLAGYGALIWECLGDLSCEVERDANGPMAAIKLRPNSRFVPRLLRQITDANVRVVGRRTHPSYGSIDSTAARSVLDHFEGQLSVFPDSLSYPAYVQLDSLRRIWGPADKAGRVADWLFQFRLPKP